MRRETLLAGCFIGCTVVIFLQMIVIHRLKTAYLELRKSTPVVVAEDGSGVTLPIEAKEGDVLQFTFNGKAWETEWKTEELVDTADDGQYVFAKERPQEWLLPEVIQMHKESCDRRFAMLKRQWIESHPDEANKFELAELNARSAREQKENEVSIGESFSWMHGKLLSMADAEQFVKEFGEPLVVTAGDPLPLKGFNIGGADYNGGISLMYSSSETHNQKGRQLPADEIVIDGEWFGGAGKLSIVLHKDADKPAVTMRLGKDQEQPRQIDLVSPEGKLVRLEVDKGWRVVDEQGRKEVLSEILGSFQSEGVQIGPDEQQQIKEWQESFPKSEDLPPGIIQTDPVNTGYKDGSLEVSTAMGWTDGVIFPSTDDAIHSSTDVPMPLH